jgi:HEAT repeat protein
VISSSEDVIAMIELEQNPKELLASSDETTRLRAARKAASGSSESVECLLGVLGDESWAVRRVAVEALAKTASPGIIDKLMRVLETDCHDLGTLNSVLQILSHSGLDTVEPLIAVLSGSHEDLRIYAAQALGDRLDSRAVAPLCQALDDPNANVRYTAIEALGKLRAVAAVDRLLQFVEEGDFFLAFPAIDALVAIGDSRIASRLTPFLQDKALRDSVATALGRLGDEQMTVPLAGLLNQPDCHPGVIAEALISLHERYTAQHDSGDRIRKQASQCISPAGVENLIDATGSVSQSELCAVATVLGWLEGPAVERSLTRLLGRPEVRREVVEALAHHGKRGVALLIEQLQAEDIDIRQAAVVGLKQIGDRAAVPALIQMLQTADDDTIPVVVGALGKIGDPRALEPLLGLIGNPSQTIRQAAVAAINLLGNGGLAARLLPLLHDHDAFVRGSAVHIAGHCACAECLDSLLECCRDVDLAVCRAALAQLSKFADERVLPTLVEALRNSEPPIRIAAVQTLGELETHQALEPLIAATEDPDMWVRYHAVRSLGQHHDPETIVRLTEVLETDTAMVVRVAVLEALGEIAGTQAILASYAKHSNPDLARAAIQSLGHINPPNATAPPPAAPTDKM